MPCCGGVCAILVDFSGWTSAHGLPHIGSATGKFLRAFWTIVTFLSITAFVFFVTKLISKYFSYPTNVQTTLKFEKLLFPAVTVCHLNPYDRYKLNELPSTPAKLTLADVNQLYDRARMMAYEPAGTFPQTLKDELTDWNMEPDETKDHDATNTKIAKKWTEYLSYNRRYNDSTNNEFDSIGYTRDDLIMACVYNTASCDEVELEQKYYAQYGYCYTFNQNASFYSTRAGPLYGLKMQIRVNQPSYSSTSTASGVRVAVHQAWDGSVPDEPFPDAYGYNCPPGFSTSFGVKYQKSERLEPPWGECSRSSSASYFYDGQFLSEGCYRSCLQEQIITKCNCYDPTLGRPESTTVDSCSVGDIATIAANMDCTAVEHNTFNVMEQCTCPQTCEEGQYSVTISAAGYPSRQFLPADCFNNTLKRWYWQRGDNWTPAPPGPDFFRDVNAPATDNATCLQWYQENTLAIEVYFERMNYQVMSEETGYSIIQMISDAGGLTGLFLGVSFITCCEFVSLGYFFWIYFCKKLWQTNDPLQVAIARTSIDEWHDDRWMENKAEEDHIDVQSPSSSSSDTD